MTRDKSRVTGKWECPNCHTSMMWFAMSIDDQGQDTGNIYRCPECRQTLAVLNEAELQHAMPDTRGWSVFFNPDASKGVRLFYHGQNMTSMIKNSLLEYNTLYGDLKMAWQLAYEPITVIFSDGTRVKGGIWGELTMHIDIDETKKPDRQEQDWERYGMNTNG